MYETSPTLKFIAAVFKIYVQYLKSSNLKTFLDFFLICLFVLTQLFDTLALFAYTGCMH